MIYGAMVMMRQIITMFCCIMVMMRCIMVMMRKIIAIIFRDITIIWQIMVIPQGRVGGKGLVLREKRRKRGELRKEARAYCLTTRKYFAEG